jgi:iron complex outermembrane recepter protein
MKRTIVAASCLAAAFAAVSTVVCAQEDAVVVTAQRFPERRLDAPVGMTVITAEEIARDTARTVPEVLSHLGGVQVRNSSGTPDQQIDLRGFGVTGDQNTLIMLDGVRLNEAELASAKLSTIPLQSIERIEILRGSGAVLYGDNAVGGTVNIVTRGPKPGRASDVLVGAGSYGTYDARASANVASGGSGITASAEHLESDNYRANNRLRQDSMAGDLRLGGERTTLGLKFGADTQRLQLPGQLSEAQIASDPRAASTPNNWSAREGAFATLTLARPLGDADFAADLGYREKESTAFFAGFGAFTYGDTRTRNLSFSPRVRAPFRLGGVDNVVVAGFDWNDGDFDRRNAESVQALGGPDFGTTGSQQRAGTYLQYGGRFAHGTKVTAGAREERVVDRQAASGSFPGPEQRTVHTLDAGELGLEQAVTDRVQVFAKYGKSFRIATIDENAPGTTGTGEPLKPQTGRGKEAGVEYRGSDARLRVSAYRIDLDNEIHFMPLVPGLFGFNGANINLPPTRRQGVELFGSERFSSALEVSGSLISQTARFRSGEFGGTDVSGHDVPLVPRRLATLRAAWQAAPSTLVTAATRYVGRQRYDNDQANLFRDMPSYSVTDLKIAHRRGRATWGLALNNAFDKRFYSYAIVDSPTAPTTFNAYPEAGRTVMGTLELAL